MGIRRLPDFLVIGQESWDQIERRNQLLIRALGQEKSALAISLRRAAAAGLARSATGDGHDRGRWLRISGACRPLRPVPDRCRSGLSDRIECAQIRQLREAGWSRSAPAVDPGSPRRDASSIGCRSTGVVYDLTDDWAAFEADPRRRAQVRAQIESLGRRADLVMACSRSLANDAQGWGAQPVLLRRTRSIPRSDDRRFPTNSRGSPARGLATPGPCTRRGSTSTSSLAPPGSRPQLVVRVLRAQPAGAVRQRSTVQAAERSSTSASAPIQRSSAYLAGFDVGLMPNLVTDFTRSLDPLEDIRVSRGGTSGDRDPGGHSR